MVTRRRFWLLLLPLFLLPVLAAAALGWLAWTETGARWLVKTATGQIPGRLTVAAVQGRLADRLDLEGVVWAGPGWDLTLQRLQLVWQPWGLLQGELDVTRLALQGADLTRRSAPAHPSAAAPATPSWPEISGWPLGLRARIKDLKVEEFRYHPPIGRVWYLRQGSGQLVWRDGNFSWPNLDLQAGFGHLTGRLDVGFAPRGAQVDLVLVPAGPGWPKGLKRLALDARLSPGTGDTLVAGSVQATALWPPEPELQLTSPIQIGAQGLALDGLELVRAGVGGTAVGQARIDWGRPGVPITLDLRLSDVDLLPEARLQTRISGTLRGQVTAPDYQGTFDLVNVGESWRDLRLAGEVSGDVSGLTLAGLAGKWLDGQVQGEIRVGWKGAPSVAVDLQGAGLNPGRLHPDWPGSVNLAAAGTLDFPPGAPMESRWETQVAPSRLLGRDFSGNFSGHAQGLEAIITELALAGTGYTLQARGALRERLTVDLRASDLGGLVPETSGQVDLSGWLRWHPGAPWAAAGTLKGRKLHWRKLAIDSLQAQGRLISQGGGEIALDGEAKELSWGPWKVDRLRTEAAGTADRHSLSLTAHWPEGRLRGDLAGGLGAAGWSGTLRQLFARDDRMGHWELQGPAELALGGLGVAWTSLALTGAAGARLESAAALQFAPLTGEIRGSWNSFDLGWLSHLLADTELSGASSGQAAVRWDAGRVASMRGEMSGQGSWTMGDLDLEFDAAEAQLDWGADGLRGSWRLDLGAHGSSSGDFTSPQEAHFSFPERGEGTARWQNLDLALLNPLLGGYNLAGTSTGQGGARWGEDQSLDLTLQASSVPVIRKGDQGVELSRADLQLRWNESGLAGDLWLAARDGGALHGRAASTEPGRLAWPQSGTFEVAGEELDLALVQPWLPAGAKVAGQLTAAAQGDWSGSRFGVEGRAAMSAGEFTWRKGSTEFAAPVRNAALTWTWRDETLSGGLEITLAERGQLQTALTVPIAAQFPVLIRESGAVVGSAEGTFSEEGLLTRIFPGVVQESQGQLSLKLALAGTWEDPQLTGTASVQGAGGYLPALGVRLQEAGLLARIERNRVVIDKLALTSGKGMVTGNGEVELDGLELQTFRLELAGENVLAVNLPELQLKVSPDLEISGHGNQVKVQGTVKVPEALIRGRQGKAPIQSSPDLVVVDAPAGQTQALPIELTLAVNVVCGDQVLVKVQGIDARLTGKVLVEGLVPDLLSGQGRIDVAKGVYAAYGVRLEITRGSLVFADSPVDEPVLDVLALRTVDDVKAGVRVTGTPRRPTVRLYSDPAMPDTDVLAYVALGHPMGSDSGQAGLLFAAAGALLSQGDSVGIQEQVQRRLGIDVIDVKTEEDEETTQSVVTVGKYLGPDLYVSVGQSTTTNTTQVGLRYNIGRHWQVESAMGTESGVDLFYRITFK